MYLTRAITYPLVYKGMSGEGADRRMLLTFTRVVETERDQMKDIVVL